VAGLGAGRAADRLHDEPQRELCGLGDERRYPAWSPDGSAIAAVRSASCPDATGAPTASSVVTLVRPDGTGARDLTSCVAGRGFNSVSWSPDGRYVVTALTSTDASAHVGDVIGEGVELIEATGPAAGQRVPVPVGRRGRPIASVLWPAATTASQVPGG
jgi:hypothetical protein